MPDAAGAAPRRRRPVLPREPSPQAVEPPEQDALVHVRAIEPVPFLPLELGWNYDASPRLRMPGEPVVEPGRRPRSAAGESQAPAARRRAGIPFAVYKKQAGVSRVRSCSAMVELAVTGNVTGRVAGLFVVLELTGEHDLATADEVRGVLRQALTGGSGVLLDLTECTFLDAAILRALHEAGEEARRRSRSFMLVPPADGRFARVFEIGNVDSIPAAASVEEALARLQIEALAESDLRLVLAAVVDRVVEGDGEGGVEALLASAAATAQAAHAPEEGAVERVRLAVAVSMRELGVSFISPSPEAFAALRRSAERLAGIDGQARG
jgi:anti-anti-sigma factor